MRDMMRNDDQGHDDERCDYEGYDDVMRDMM